MGHRVSLSAAALQKLRFFSDGGCRCRAHHFHQPTSPTVSVSPPRNFRADHAVTIDLLYGEALGEQLAVALPDLQRPGSAQNLPGVRKSITPDVQGPDRGGEIRDVLAIGIAGLGVGDAGRRNFPYGSQRGLGIPSRAERAKPHAKCRTDAGGFGRCVLEKLDVGNRAGESGRGAWRLRPARPARGVEA